MNILIVTYTYPPAKSVNGFRPYHFAKALTAAGWKVSVLTRHFTGQERIPEDYSRPNRLPFAIDRQPEALVYRVPFYNSWFNYFQYAWIRNTGLWKMIYFIQLLVGRTHQESYNKYFKIYLPTLLKQKSFELILVESGPTNLVRLVSRYAMKYKVLYAIDFRDAYYHDMYRDPKTLTWNKKIKIQLEERYMSVAIRNAVKVISLSNAWLDLLKVPAAVRTIVENGFDETAWKQIKKNQPVNRFVISSIGTLYDQPVLNELLKSIALFLNQGHQDVQVRFIAPGGQAVLSKIKHLLPYENVHLEEHRISYQDAIQCAADSHVLIYHGWKGWSELSGTKIYDYLRSGNKILVVPSDDGPIKKWLTRMKAGVITDSPEEGASALQQWYEEWKTNGSLESNTDLADLLPYSREAQGKILEQTLRSLLIPG